MRPDSPFAYGVGLGIIAVATAVRLALAPFLIGVPFVTFFPSVILAAFLCGPRAGMAAAVTSALSGWYFFVPPAFSFARPDASHAITILGYTLAALFVAFAMGSLRQATAAQRESEVRQQALFENAGVGMVVLNRDCSIVDANEAYCRIVGQEREALTASSCLRFTHPEDVPAHDKALAELEADGKPVAFEKRYLVGKRVAWVRVTLSRIGDERLLAVIEDISERKQAELRMRGLFEGSPVGMAVYDGGLQSSPLVNDCMLALADIERAEFESGTRSFNDATAPEHRARDEEARRQMVRTGRITPYQKDFIHRDGTRVAVLVSGRLLHENWRLAIVSAQDLTAVRDAEEALKALNEGLEARVAEEIGKRVEVEEALRHAQKLEAMGQLTGGVAHDFNNLLTPIVGGLDMLQRMQLDPRAMRYVSAALASAERARTLVHRLLAFARRQPLKKGPVDIAALVAGLDDILVSTLGPQIALSVEIEEGLPAAAGDANQLEMAILNLAVNARDAMPTGGRLTIGARAQGEWVELSISDTGVGMDEATVQRAVEPFFSTKGLGRGTGLGLSMVHGLVAQLGGRLSIGSVPGQGTTVTLILPAARETPPSTASTRRARGRRAGLGVALLVDDEELVRGSTAAMLAELGYSVVEAGSAEEALELIRSGLRPDVVLTDHLMPGMTGAELVVALRKRRPPIPALIVSGYAEVDGIDHDLPRLAKPFRQSELADALEHLTVHHG